MRKKAAINSAPIGMMLNSRRNSRVLTG